MGASGLGALLVKEGFLTEQDRVTITKTCGQGSWAFAKCILSTGLLDEDELSAFFAERTKYVVAPKNLLDRLDPGIIEQIDRRMVSRLEVLPLEIDHHKITVAVADPLDKSTIKQLEFFTGLEVVSVIAPLSQIYEGLSRLNPEFKPRPTALSNFLRNHAGAAWIKQKIVDEGDVDAPQEKRSARSGAVEDFNEDDVEDDVEDVSLDDELDALEESSDSLNDIDAGGLDEGIGNSDFDDIELEDNGSDLELTPGDDPDEGLSSGEPIDDAGLDLDDPFDNFDDAPKAAKNVAAPSDDDLEGLESGGGSNDDLWPDDDAPAAPPPKKPAAAPAKAAAAMPDDFGLDDDEPKAKPGKKAAPADMDDFGLDDDEPKAKPVKKAAAPDDDFGLDDTPSGLDDELEAKPAKKAAAADDDFGLDDTPSGLDDELDAKPAKKATAADDDFGLGDDDSDMSSLLDDEPKVAAAASKPAKKAAAADEDFGLSDDDADIGGLLDDEPADKVEAADADDDDIGSLLDDEPKAKPVKAAPASKSAKKAAAADDDFGLSDDDDDVSNLLDDEPKAKPAKTAAPAKKAAAADDDFGLSDDDDDVSNLLDDEPKAKPAKTAAPVSKPAKKATAADDDFRLSDDDANIDGLLDDEPKAKPAKKAAAADDEFGLSDDDADIGGLLDDEPANKVEAADIEDDDIGSLLDDEPKAAPAKKAAAADDDFGLSDDDADIDGLLADEPAKKAEAADVDDDDIGSLLDDEPKAKPAKAVAPESKPAKKAAAADDDDDMGSLLDEPKAKPASAAKPKAQPAKKAAVDAKPTKKVAASTDDELGGLLDDNDDLELSANTEQSTDSLDDDINLDSDLQDEDIDALLDEPAPPSKAPGSNLLAFDKKQPPESTRMAIKPSSQPMEMAHDDDHESVEFADDEETSASLRKAVHEDGVLPEFTDPSADGIEEETRIDLHAATDDDDDDLQFNEEDTQIKLHPSKADGPKLEDLSMGFDDEESIDEPAVAAAKPSGKSWGSEPAIDDFGADADLADIPIDEPAPPVRAGGKSSKPAPIENGSVASLTATAKANEGLLRMSLCFDRSSALEIAREYLPQISGTGCLIDIGKTTENLATWRAGAQTVAKGKSNSAIQSMAKAAKPGQWSQVAVNAAEDLFGSVKSVSVYTIKKADGRTLLLAGDYPIEDETLREALTSFAEQLGAK